MDMIRTISTSGKDNNDAGISNRNLSQQSQRIESDEMGVFAGPPTSVREGSVDSPAEILPFVEPVARVANEVDEDEEDEEDDYEYEDDEDNAFSGFLVNDPALVEVQTAHTVTEESTSAAPATIRDEEEQPAAPAAVADTRQTNKMKWRQPSKEAVSMSLRAEKEKTGGKRRLAQDLYRIMNQDTQEAGFSLQPSQEDSMDKWTIKLFQFDEDSNLAKDMLVLGLEDVELEMSFPDQYPFEPPFVRVVKPRFKRQTGFVMNGALCMELLTKDGWSPINDIESVIVSIRSLLAVGDGRLEAAFNLSDTKYTALLLAAQEAKKAASKAKEDEEGGPTKRQRKSTDSDVASAAAPVDPEALADQQKRLLREQGGAYSVSEAQAAYSHLSDYHKKKGWDTSGWWARKG